MQTLEQRLEAIEAKLGIVADAPAPVKDWEIQSFKALIGDLIFTKFPGGYGMDKEYLRSTESMLGSSDSVKSGNWQIHSVKRLSDDITLTVGQNTNRGIIQRFTLKDECMFVKCDSTVFEYLLNIVEPAPPTPSFTFTTHDGVVITDHEQVVYGLFKDGLSSSGGIVAELYIITNKHLFFSTELARDSYRVMNSKCLSLYDVVHMTELLESEISILENLVQSRLK